MSQSPRGTFTELGHIQTLAGDSKDHQDVDKLRNMLSDMTNDICNAQERIAVALSGNTFEIQLHDCSINITINKEGGRR